MGQEFVYPSTGSDADNAPPVVVDELRERCMGNPAVVLVVLETFERQLGLDLLEIQEGVEERDFKKVGQVAHSLKGSASSAAAPALSTIASSIEEMTRRNEFDALQGQVDALRSEIDRCLFYLPRVQQMFDSTACSVNASRGNAR